MCVLMKRKESRVMKMLLSVTLQPSSVTQLSGTTTPSGSGALASDGERETWLVRYTQTYNAFGKHSDPFAFPTFCYVTALF